MSKVNRWLLLAMAAAPAMLMAACTGPTRSMPREYGPLVLASGDACPLVAGRYFEAEGPINDLLFLARVMDLPEDADRAWVELAGSADTSLHVTVTFRDSTARYGTLRRGTPWEGDYFCEDGWLKVADHRISGRWDRDITDAEFHPKRRAFWVAPNADSGLVGRLQFIAFTQVDVWCGDGCRGIPVPGTFDTKDSWFLAERYDPDLPPPVARRREAERQQVLADLERAKRDPVYQEEQLLENGPPDPELDAVRRRALISLPDGVLLRGVGRQPDGFHLSVEFGELYQLQDFMQRLEGSGPVDALRVAPHSRSRTTQGRWTDVVFIRYAP